MMFELILVAAAAAAPDHVEIVRKHAPKQRYALEYKNDDQQLKLSKTFKGTALVKAVEGKKTTFDVTLDSLEWVSNGKDKRTASGVKLKVEVNDGAASAEVVAPGSLGDDAEFELTSFEQMMGDICVPPKGPYYPKQPLVEGSTQWELLSHDTEKKIVRLKSTPAVDKPDPFTCEVSISLDDGFAGERNSSMRLQLGGKGLNVDQKQSFKAKKL
ncbi:MAG: hypothetical protein JNK82_19235 [Myxococcaceae bacterium]|nr:hypothetical protein [Myxococcaceae bacterium]